MKISDKAIERIIEALKSSPIKLSSIEKEAGLYQSKLHHIINGKRLFLKDSERKSLYEVAKKYNLIPN